MNYRSSVGMGTDREKNASRFTTAPLLPYCQARTGAAHRNGGCLPLHDDVPGVRCPVGWQDVLDVPPKGVDGCEAAG